MKYSLSYDLVIDPNITNFEPYRATLDLDVHVPISISGSLKDDRVKYEDRKKKAIELIVGKSREEIDAEIKSSLDQKAKALKKEIKDIYRKTVKEIEDELESSMQKDYDRDPENFSMSRWQDACEDHYREFMKYLERYIFDKIQKDFNDQALASLASSHYDKVIKDASQKYNVKAEKGRSKIKRQIVTKGLIQSGTVVTTFAAAAVTLASSSIVKEDEEGLTSSQYTMMIVGALGVLKSLYETTRDLALLSQEWDLQGTALQRLVSNYNIVESKLAAAVEYAELMQEKQDYENVIRQYEEQQAGRDSVEEGNPKRDAEDYKRAKDSLNKIMSKKSFKDGMNDFTASWKDLKRSHSIVMKHFIDGSKSLRTRRKKYNEALKVMNQHDIEKLKNGKHLDRDLNSLKSSVEKLSSMNDKMMDALSESDKLLKAKGWHDGLPVRVRSVSSSLGRVAGALNKLVETYRADVNRVNDGVQTTLMRSGNL